MEWSLVKIRLIEPDPPVMHMWSYTAYPRLGLPMIGAALKAAGHDVRIYAPKTAPIDWADVESADVVGLSTTTSTAPAAYAMADRLRARGVPVVIGGSHVTFMADEALEHADYVARGEGGEELMLELIEVLEGAREPDSVGGLSFRRDGTAVHNEVRPPCPDLDQLPMPDLDLIVGHEGVNSMPIMTSWGCPFDCTFCSVTAMFGRKYRFRSPENVMEELRAKRPKRIFFYDDNLAANKARLKRLLTMMIDEGIVVPWQAQMRTDVVTDPELLDLMRRSGCERIALGLESLDQATLDDFEKSQTVADIERAIALLNDHGILSFGMFVVGTDADTPRSVREIARFSLRQGITTLMLNILTPAAGDTDVRRDGRRGTDPRQGLEPLRRAARRLRAAAHDPAPAAARDPAGLPTLLLHAPPRGQRAHPAHPEDQGAGLVLVVRAQLARVQEQPPALALAQTDPCPSSRPRRMMGGDLWGTLLPLIVASAVVPVQITLTVLLLRSSVGTAAAWVGGMTATRLAQGVLFGLVFAGAGTQSESGDGTGLVEAGLLLVIAVLLLTTAVRTLLGGSDEDDLPPKWMKLTASATPGRAFLLGAGFVAVAAKLWVFTLGAIGAIEGRHWGGGPRSPSSCSS